MSKPSTPQTQQGSLQHPPNIVGKRPTPEEFTGKYIVRAVAQKIVGVPKSLLTENVNKTLEFKLTVAVSTSGEGIVAAQSKAPPVNVAFASSHIKQAPSGQNEVTLSENPMSGATWSVQAEGRNQLSGRTAMKVTLVEVCEGRTRVLFEQMSPIILQKVLDRKVLVFLYGTPIGRLGITLSVSSDDKDGFHSRMSRFLKQFSQISNSEFANKIAEQCDEITTFAYLWKYFNIVDYSARLKRYLKLYSRRMLGQEEALLAKYKMHEEDLFMNLVLDNGPEELDIDPKRRLEAVKTRFSSVLGNLDVENESRRDFGSFLEFIDKIVDQHGPEPDPRTYLFPDIPYQPPQSSADSADAGGSSGSPAMAMPSATPGSQSNFGSSSSASPTMANNNSSPRFGAPGGGSSSPTTGGRNTATSGGGGGGASFQQQHQPRGSGGTNSASSPSASSPTGASATTAASSPAAAQQGAAATTADLWSSFVSALGSRRISSSDIFFLSDDAFQALMGQLNVNPAHRHLVMSEWRRRSAENLQLTHFAPTDPSFDTVRTELLTMTGMQPINLSVLGVVGLRNIEHETTHSARLNVMKSKGVDRCVYVGEYNTLLKSAERGITAVMTASDAGLCFPRRPFAAMEKPTAVSAMICDVVVGKQTNAATLKEAALADSDTVSVGGTGSEDASLFVRDVRHVLPRFIVHCHVDPTLVPCPLHPNKQVEYYIVDAQAFACSNCVVLGPHVGKPIVTLDEALQWARTQLNDLLRDAEAVGSAANEIDRDMAEHLRSITGESAQKKKQDLVETIRREAELRAQDAAKQLEAEMAMQADIIASQQARLAPLRSSMTQTQKLLQNTTRQGNVAKALDVLQSLSTTYDGTDLRSKILEVKDALAVMPSLTSSTMHRPPWAIASANAIGGSGGGGGGQQHHSLGRSQSEQSNPAFSRFMEAASTVAVQRQINGRSSAGATPSSTPLMQGQDHALYQKFLSSAGGGRSPATTSLPQHHHSNSMSPAVGHNNNAASSSMARSDASGQQPTDKLQQAGRQLLQEGWKAFRSGDTGTTRSLWMSAAEKYGNTAIGARAQAYIAEALDKDAAKASEWYERALQCDPTDCMTLFNYGVLLEATGHTFRALQLFESAQRLGDVMSGKRARAIRQHQLAASDN